MRVLHLSDIHYSLGAKDARREADGCGDNVHGAVAEVGDRPLSLPAAEFYPAMVDRLGDVLPAFEACLREGLAADDAGERVGAIVLTGDFVERGGEAAYRVVGEAVYRACREVLGAVVPCIVTPGNHDDRAALRAGWPGALSGLGGEPLLYAQEVADVRLISFDTSEPGHADGYVDAERLAWLRGELEVAESRGQTALVCTHHHVDPSQTDMPALPGAVELLELLRRPGVAVLNGHTHHQAHRVYEGVEYHTADATSFQADPCDVHPAGGAPVRAVRFRRLSGYNVYDVRDRRIVRACAVTYDGGDVLGDMLLG